MQAQAYEGYFNNGQFYVSGKAVRIPGRRRAVLTIFSEQVQEDKDVNPSAWLDDFRKMVDESAGEKLRMEDFPRMNLGREPIIFVDEE